LTAEEEEAVTVTTDEGGRQRAAVLRMKEGVLIGEEACIEMAIETTGCWPGMA